MINCREIKFKSDLLRTGYISVDEFIQDYKPLKVLYTEFLQRHGYTHQTFHFAKSFIRRALEKKFTKEIWQPANINM